MGFNECVYSTNCAFCYKFKMTEVSVDPLCFLNIKKKRLANKQREDFKTLFKKQPTQQTSRFLLPSFSSQNSLGNDAVNKITKAYNPLKYFNPQIEQYLNKLQQSKIANMPIMTSTQPQISYNRKQILGSTKNCNNQPTQMMTFATNLDLSNNETKPTFNFLKLGLQKSGSMKMMQKLQQQTIVNTQVSATNTGISPWSLPENSQESPQLRQCEVCSRKFNLKSYEKHIKVCEKVFFQKRKPFNSRSSSLEKKTTAN